MSSSWMGRSWVLLVNDGSLHPFHTGHPINGGKVPIHCHGGKGENRVVLIPSKFTAPPGARPMSLVWTQQRPVHTYTIPSNHRSHRTMQMTLYRIRNVPQRSPRGGATQLSPMACTCRKILQLRNSGVLNYVGMTTGAVFHENST